jgi:hypothetical protein
VPGRKAAAVVERAAGTAGDEELSVLSARVDALERRAAAAAALGAQPEDREE